jgi:hypothetical protein
MSAVRQIVHGRIVLGVTEDDESIHISGLHEGIEF